MTKEEILTILSQIYNGFTYILHCNRLDAYTFRFTLEKYHTAKRNISLKYDSKNHLAIFKLI